MSRYMPTFTEFLNEAKADTSNYVPPKYVVKPAKDDKGYEMFAAAFNRQKPYFKPGIKSSNEDVEDHDFDKDRAEGKGYGE